ncbi:PaaI family thioesterase [Conexibacter woesei]|uniref:Thioesterase superfamily protein n=1 Tax=Conexibacter woesei (strain DSM 14684 / CCUG 47730 / CIP 108061 / JCM 11494 / NBRC 100937 / ID131577) TaxID=469383 RepID=D3EZD7_CONWI|nr:PaaI family thioesterase [Conexibacter woesei]ADB51902.1 thioesterase superfamily protein [Conexibacter woesei DSM 14684]
MSLRPLPPSESGFDSLLGYEELLHGDGEMRARIPVKPELLQPFGLVHGGVYASVAETLASLGTFLGVSRDGMHAMGLSNQTSFIRPITEGHINVSARAIHRGSTTWIWECEVRDDADRLCAVTRMTIAVRAPRAS